MQTPAARLRFPPRPAASCHAAMLLGGPEFAAPSQAASTVCSKKPLARLLRPAVGLIIFNSGAATLRPLAPAGTADMADLMDGIDALCAAGSTNLQVILDGSVQAFELRCCETPKSN